MSTYLPPEVQEGLDAARRKARLKASRLRVRSDDGEFPVLRAWEGGFALEAENAQNLRGLVDVYEGTRHLMHCLIITSEEEAGERRFEYKLMNDVSDTQPLDFARAPDAPVALIGQG